MRRPAARISDITSHGTPLLPGPGSWNVLIGGLPAWRGVPAGAASALQKKKEAADIAILAAKNAVKAALATGSGVAAAEAAVETLKWELAAQLGTEFTALAAGADIHICPVSSPPPPHGSGVVINGSSTVLINNLPACRMGDTVLEAVGGDNKIASGCPTVLIGDGAAVSPFGLRGLALYLKVLEILMDKEARKQLLPTMAAALRALAVDIALGQLERRISAFLADRASLEPADLQKAIMSQATYANQGKPGEPLDGTDFHWATDEELARLNIDRDLLNNAETGFSASVFMDGDGNAVISYEGTEFTDTEGDWPSNIRQGLGFEDAQYEQAIEIAQKAQANLPPGASLEYTGHSLGGGLAAAASLQTGAPATTFNASGVHDATVSNIDSATLARREQNVTNISTTNDILTNIQNSDVLGLPPARGQQIVISSESGALYSHELEDFDKAVPTFDKDKNLIPQKKGSV